MSTNIEIGSLSLPTILTEAELRFLENHRASCAEMTANPELYAFKQGQGMAEHFRKFVRGEQEAFGATFYIGNDHHKAQMKGFMESVLTSFPVHATVTEPRDHGSNPNSTVGQIDTITFGEVGAGLIVTHNMHPNREVYGVNYSGFVLPDRPDEFLGGIATSWAMS